MKDKGLSPRLSIDEHCRYYCQNDMRGRALCTTPDCKLRAKGTNLQKVKNWCKECALDHLPYRCDGEILNTAYTRKWKCPLHKYRMGRNPNIKGNNPTGKGGYKQLHGVFNATQHA